jgi:hypothetical protein
MSVGIKEVKQTIAQLKQDIRKQRQSLEILKNGGVIEENDNTDNILKTFPSETAASGKNIDLVVYATDKLIIKITNDFKSTFHSSSSFKNFLGSPTTLPAKGKSDGEMTPNNSDGILTPYPFGEPVNDDNSYYRIVDVNLSAFFNELLKKVPSILQGNTDNKISFGGQKCNQPVPTAFHNDQFLRLLYVSNNGYAIWDSSKPSGYENGPENPKNNPTSGPKKNELYTNTWTNSSFKDNVIVNYKSKEGAIIPYSWKRSDAVFKASANDTGISVVNKIYFSSSFSESNSVIVCDFAYKLYNSTHKLTAGYLLLRVYNFTFTSDKHGN